MSQGRVVFKCDDMSDPVVEQKLGASLEGVDQHYIVLNKGSTIISPVVNPTWAHHWATEGFPFLAAEALAVRSWKT